MYVTLGEEVVGQGEGSTDTGTPGAAAEHPLC